MLSSLVIRDILIIDHLVLEFQPGLNVLTGETGAGKSILLDSLGFVLGWRGRADIVRLGASEGSVEAEFELGADHPAHELLREAGLDDEGALVIRRVVKADGRKTGWINNRRASGDLLRKLSDVLIEVHGQNDEIGLLDPRNHGSLLDEFASLTSEVEACRRLWAQAGQAGKAVAVATEELARAQEEEEYLRHAVAELSEIGPVHGEADKLDQKRRLMQAVARVGEDIERAARAVGMDGAENDLGNAMRWLEGAANKTEGELDDALAGLGRALDELGHAQGEIERARDRLTFDQSELERVEERLFALRGLARKYSVPVDDLDDLLGKMSEQLAAMDNADEALDVLRVAEINARAKWQEKADVLTRMRQKASDRLKSAMQKELAPLKMDRADFLVALTQGFPGPRGQDKVEFRVATNPGAPSGVLNKIASGGELSRFMLALKVCLLEAGGNQTVIFDEIDRGVGGATADAVGARLAALAKQAQILVVTHSPQVAAKGAHQWQVAKDVQGGETRSRVTRLDAAARVDEIARMLAGDRVTEAARAAAQALLDGPRSG